jgi:hypothetical protein
MTKMPQAMVQLKKFLQRNQLQFSQYTAQFVYL